MPLLVREQRATLTLPSAHSGTGAVLFDGNRYTEVKADPGKGGEVFFQVVLDRPRALSAVDVIFSAGGTYRWTLAGANTAAELAARKGSYRLLVTGRDTQDDRMDQTVLTAAPAFRAYRLRCRRLTGEGTVNLGEWALWTEQVLTSVQIDSFAPNVAANGGVVQLRATGRFDAGARQNLTGDVLWEITPPERGEIDVFTRFAGKAAGPARVTAIHEDLRSQALPIEVLPVEQARPDWVISHIERLPRVPHDDPQLAPKVGQSVYWLVHVKNYGTAEGEPANVEWKWDGKVLGRGKLPRMPRFAQTEVMIGSKWDGQSHEFEFVIDPANAIPETSEENNRLAINTTATPVGFWVEDGTLKYFHAHQHRLGIGSNCWEDWAQRQVRMWNETGKAPEGAAPAVGGAGKRYRLDRVIVVADGMLPLAGGSPTREPDRREKTVSLMFGFPASDARYRQTAERREGNPFYLDTDLRQRVSAAVP